MSRLLNTVFVSALIILCLAATAFAHFQLIYTPEAALQRGGELDLTLVFTHPFSSGHTMDMAPIEEFYVISQRGEDAEPKKTNLMEFVREIKWTTQGNSGVAYEAKLPKKIVRSMGDYTFVMVPGPYYESEEDTYIQQITKMMINVGGVPGNWSEPLGLPTEIVALDKPYANWEGGVFRGIVLSNGKPVPNADLEIEFLNHLPVEGKNTFAEKGVLTASQDAFVTMSIKANDRGEFTIGLPVAGWWGICALGTGPVKEHKGKELSQDAVLWVKAAPVK